MFTDIRIQKFRGFKDLKVQSLDRFNLFLGRNNAGKSSLLEAIFLLVGPTNPELPLRVNGLRGIEQYKNDPEEIWGWLFYEKKTQDAIRLEAKISEDKTVKLSLSLREPSEFRYSTNKKHQAQIGSPTSLSTTGVPAELIIKYTDDRNIKHDSKAYLREGTIAFQRAKAVRTTAGVFVSSRGGYSPENAERFSKLEEIGRERELLPWMKILEPRLNRLAILITGSGPVIHGDIGIGVMVPLPFMGEGVGRLLTLLLSIASSKSGVVLVDEIEVGLHHSVMASVWTAVAQACREYDVQLMATTHSWECLRSASESFGETRMYDFKAHRLDRSDGEVECITYDRSMIETAMESGLELR